jgi:hypothetical protein
LTGESPASWLIAARLEVSVFALRMESNSWRRENISAYILVEPFSYRLTVQIVPRTNSVCAGISRLQETRTKLRKSDKKPQEYDLFIDLNYNLKDLFFIAVCSGTRTFFFFFHHISEHRFLQLMCQNLGFPIQRRDRNIPS